MGKEENGGAYFNRFRIVELTPEQEALVARVAKATFRPCRNNSTFFQDCNHGSALLGLLQLGASQGLTEDELCQEALAFNAFWFPQVYVQTALYYQVMQGVDWTDVDPRIVMGARYSALGPVWRMRSRGCSSPGAASRSSTGIGVPVKRPPSWMCRVGRAPTSE